jgi:CRISPR-associated protein Cas2
MAPQKRSSFRMGWLLVMFDLPVLTKAQRKSATRFREDLLQDGFTMVQFSVYTRPCPTQERLEKHGSRLKAYAPEGGNIRVLFLTDYQWARGYCISGSSPKTKKESLQLELNLPEQSEFW